ncbi:BON domain-containing protein [Actinoplanes hulinensis]|uniref:BON domain-containing protein n=1 Tax=Actinoplanes hulinensis TaxID=1144547 RepID=A0ABS7B811_9ACTN|nr:BON domain-containing protein [Actinoplanes hulinensis]MBW6437103.1 BON domain-containing protein [Actinoplanes hulinensis]
MWSGPFEDPPVISQDLRLAWRVTERIVADARLAGEPIGVVAQNRVVTLTGVVGSVRARAVAGEVAGGFPGVADVCNRLETACPAGATTDPFEQLVAQWAGERPDPARLIRARLRRERLLKAAVVLAALSVVLLVLLPRLTTG